tara:strand:+ start:498 stop:731 length:234 start_codon:yes stop_codon:yes gene_type:complete
MIVTTITGNTVNITVNFDAKEGAVDTNGHTIFRTQQSIDDFINEISSEEEPDDLVIHANDLLIDNEKPGEDITKILL